MKNKVSTITKRILFMCMVLILLYGVCGCTASSEERAEIGTEDSRENASEIEERNSQPQMDVEIGENKPDTEIAENEPEEERAEPEDYDNNTLKNSNYFEDLEDLEKNHRILPCDIGSSPKYDYENTPLAEYVEEDITNNEEMSKKRGGALPLEIDYHSFDFNNDGIEDYLLCESGLLFNGNGSCHVDIYIREEKGVRLVLSMPMFFHNSPADHEKLIILDEKTNGYYAIVPPYKNFILRYDAEKGWYETEDRQGNALGVDDEQDEPEMDMESKETVIEKEETASEKEDARMVRNNNYYLDFEDLEKNHKILAYDICSEPKYDYENTPLAEYVEEIIARNEEGSKEVGRELALKIYYHLFDFNDDGIEDYLLRIYGENSSLFPENFWGEGEVSIYIQEEGEIRKVLFADIRLDSRSRLTVLDEKTNGYYAIVPSYGNYILRYDAEQGRYDFGVRECVRVK